MNRACTKAKYANEVFANQHIERLMRTSTRKLIPCRSYFCQYCGCWHITSTTGSVDVEKMRSLTEENARLKREIQALKKTHNDEDNKNFRINEMIKFLNEANAKVIKKNKELQDTISRILTQSNSYEIELKQYKEKYGNK